MMESRFDKQKAEETLKGNFNKAEDLLNDAAKVEDFLNSIDKKLEQFPILLEKIRKLPVMVDLVKSFAKKEYQVVPLKSIIAIVAALIYLLSAIDLIPDFIPALGFADDIAVIAVCLKLVDSDIDAYLDWKISNSEIIEA